jgi:hypothetical protein
MVLNSSEAIYQTAQSQSISVIEIDVNYCVSEF